ncbi:MAG: glutaredoxin family protein [Rhodanobacteraceae bacterium]|nr:glutaredoxin family protein [Rhodanobacteraceae bacterium]
MSRMLLLIAGLLVGLHWFANRGPAPGDPRIGASDGDITMLSATWCGYCDALRRDLDGMGVRYKELDIEDGAAGEAAFDAIGARGVPVLLVGQQVINGYDPERSRNLIVAAGHAVNR